MPVGHRFQAMDLKRLRTFVAVAELGTDGRALVASPKRSANS
jgi:hypothetical protein